MAVELNAKQRALIEEKDRPDTEPVLSVKDLVISFRTDNGKVQAVRGVSFDLAKGETLCIVGESGSGKSVTSKAIMGILASNAIVEGGQIIYEGEDLLRVSEEEFHRIRGHKIGMIFQDPLSSLNPIVKIGKQITETMLINANQLKNHYKELYADELSSYKNAKVIRDADIAKANNVFNNLKSDCDRRAKKAKEEVDEAKKALAETKKAGHDTVTAESNLANKKAALEAIETENAKLLGDAKKVRDEAIAKAKSTYKEQIPGLKKNLKVRKAEAKIENKEYAQKLLEDRDAKLAEIEKEKAELKVEKETLDRILELESQIKDLKKGLKKREIGFYFLNKKKQKARAEFAEKIAPLKKERDELAKEIDALNAKEEEINNDYRFHIKVTRSMAKAKALKVMKEVGIPQPEQRFKQYPFQFSGGMRQRIVIAIALIAEPNVLICDEPTTALDVTIQAQILELINRLKAAHDMSVIFITHDLGVVANMADRVAVMYAGKIIEYGTDKEIFFDPRHPYTWALLSSIPDIDSKEKLEAIPGTPPDMIYPPVGDAFTARNRYALAIDYKYQPPYFEITPTHYVATWLEHPSAPKVEPPKIVSQRIFNALKEEEEKRHE